MAPKEENIDFDDQIQKKTLSQKKQESSSESQTNQSNNKDTEKYHFQPTSIEKLLNFITCRNDLSNQTLEAKPVSVLELFRYAKRFDWYLIVIGLVCATINGVSNPMLVVVGSDITNALILYPPNSSKFLNTAYKNAYAFTGLGCLLLVSNFLQFWCFHQCVTRIMSKMRHEYMKSVLRQNAAWFDNNHSGTLASKLNEDMTRIQDGVGDKLGLLYRGAVIFISSVVISFIYDWRLTLMMCGVIPLSCICMSVMARMMTSTTEKELDGVGKAGAIAEEALMGVRTVQAFNGQQEMVDRYCSQLERGRHHALWKGFWSGLLGGAFFCILFIFLGAGFLYGAYIYKWGLDTNPGNIFAAVVCILLGGYFLGLIYPQLMVLLNARVAAAVIYQTIDRIPEIDCYAKTGEVLKSPKGRIVFKDVHFRYPSRSDVKVLNGLHLIIEPGATVALVGYSGCGKSTSVSLLARLYEAESGNVTIDGVDVKDLNIDYLRNIIGIVQQEPYLFNDTVAGNLKNGNPNMSYEEMERVCIMANADDFIKKLPNGYDTYIGDGGVQLSGGQKQRIAIARTLARDPKILLLDEATSALDAQSEGIVQEALNKATKGRSTIVIAHRLSTVKDANKIVFIEDGRVVEEGTHDQLVSRRGRYYELVKAQQFQPEDNYEKRDDETSIGISRNSSRNSKLHRSIRDIFMRANSINDSVNRFGSKGNTDIQAYAMEVQKVMDEDAKISAGYWDIFKNSKGNLHWLSLGVVTAILLGLQLPGLAAAYGYEFTAYQVLPSDPTLITKAWNGFYMFIGIGIGIIVLQTISSILFAVASQNISLRFRLMSFKNILYQDASYFDNPNHTPAKLINRLASDAPDVKAVIDERAMVFLVQVTALIICIFQAIYYQWQVGLFGACIVIGQFFITSALAIIIMNKNIEIVKHGEAARLSIEIIENVQTIQLLTRTQKFYDMYEEASKKQKRSELNKGIYEGINFSIMQSITCWMLAIGYSLAIYLIYKGITEQNSAFQAVNTMLLAAVAAMNAAPCFPEFIKAKAAAGMLFSTIYRQSKTGDASKGDIIDLHGNITFDSVNFSYPQRPDENVMNGLNISIAHGQTVALVGPSGSGKSTCIAMLERFYDCTRGTVRLDGKDIRLFCLNHLRTQMSLVGQETRLFAGSIKQNICFGLKDVSLDRIEEAMKTANAYNFVHSLPMGLDTDVGENGTQLSAGQKQRIAIARALVRNPKILLLDEATSALDSDNEKTVQEALDRAREGRTCITIAHRLSSIQNADIIVYIDNGKVLESGTHSSLMQKRGKYYNLIKKQELAI